jgi:pimeloyl-ACP methyl ester carboxylesterase
VTHRGSESPPTTDSGTAPDRHQGRWYRCVAYDHLGQGLSEGEPNQRTIDVQTLYEDALARVHALDLAPCGSADPSAASSGCDWTREVGGTRQARLGSA